MFAIVRNVIDFIFAVASEVAKKLFLFAVGVSLITVAIVLTIIYAIVT